MRLFLASSILTILSFALLAADAPKVETTPEQQFAQLKALADSVVTVEYTLKYDNGEAPRVGFESPTPGQTVDAGERIVKEERPLEVFSYLLGDDLVVSEELPVHERFIEKIQVRFRDQLVPAHPVAWATRRHAAFLKLDQPLKGAKPLSFNPDLPGPYTGLVAGADHGVATISITPFAPSAVISPELGQYISTPREAVAVNAAGQPVGMSMSEFLAAGDTWKGDPRKWEQLSADQRKDLLDKTRQAADAGIVRVTLNFRSPKSQPNPFVARMRIGRGGGPEEQNITERNLLGLALEDGRVLIPASMRPELTARLERIRIYRAQGDAADAKFLASLKDYGAIIARLDKPAGAIKLSNKPITAYHNRLLPHANIEVRGEERVVYLGHKRIEGFARGWRNHVYPNVPDDRDDTYLFDDQGTLLAFPIARREKFGGDQPRFRRSADVTPTVYILEALANLDANIDPSNVPLSEDQESRIAWLGVVLQPLNRELARANKVAEQTQDGRTGALVNFVYPDSPAAKAGVEPGWILLRLRVPGHPQPVEVTVSEGSAGFPLPWERYDELPEQFYDRLPTPWPNAENELTRTLTEAGFGAKVQAEFFADGKLVTKDFTVEQSPPHYDGAPRHKSEALGLTVRDLTYEVRQYFQLTAEDPGVIVSRIEPGSRGSVAGIKPYEMITHVNGQPIKNVQNFAQAIKAGGELRLTVKRMTRTRQVPVRLDTPNPAAGKKAPPPGAPAAESPDKQK